MTKWSALPNDESQVDSTTEIVDLQGGNSNQRIRFSIPTLGQSVVPVHKITDIPLVSGFRQFEQDKVYQFVEEISSSETLLIPAGWNGYIVGIHKPLTKYDYTGTGNALQTLNLSATIDVIGTAGGGSAILVITNTPHGLTVGQFINITGTTQSAYNIQKVLVTVVLSGDMFEALIPYVGDASGGAFDTGYDAINIMNMAFTNDNTSDWLNVIASTTSSVFRYDNIKISGFREWGRITEGTVIGYDGDFSYASSGPNLFNIDKAIISTTILTLTDISATGATTLLLEGPLTRDIILENMQFNVAAASQDAIRIESDITNADRISITNSPDNNIGNGFFDASAGGLNQTDPQVFTFNNGIRSNSATQSESRSVGVLEVDGSGGIAVPIEDLTPTSGDFILDNTSEEFSMDTSTGVVTYNGLATRTVLIGYSLEAAQASGANQNLTFDLRINNVQQTKTIRSMITMGVGSFISVVLVGGFFIINPGDTFKLFKDNTSNTNNTDIQNTILLIR